MLRLFKLIAIAGPAAGQVVRGVGVVPSWWCTARGQRGQLAKEVALAVADSQGVRDQAREWSQGKQTPLALAWQRTAAAKPAADRRCRCTAGWGAKLNSTTTAGRRHPVQ